MPVQELAVPPLDVEDLITEDDTPVDNFASEKEQRLLTEALYASWPGPGAGRKFLAAANVGIYFGVERPPLVPDMFLSLDVTVPTDWWAKRHRCYFTWEFGKPPEVVVELVSNREGNEVSVKPELYAKMGVAYYAIHDPLMRLQDEPLRLLALREGRYVHRADNKLPEVGLQLVLWDGIYEDKQATWLRWADATGNLVATGRERADRAEQGRDHAEQLAGDAEQRAEQAAQRAEEAVQRADRAAERAEQAEQRLVHTEQRAKQLAERLRALGVDPDNESS